MLKYDDYFIKELKKGNYFKICFMVNRNNWESLVSIDDEYENCQIDTFGDSTEYLIYRKDVANDYDLILLSSDRFYNDYEREDLQSMASRISSLEQKRVTIGYISVLSREKEGNKAIRQFAKIISFKNGIQEIRPNLVIDEYFDILDFLNFVSKTHKELEIEKVKKRI